MHVLFCLFVCFCDVLFFVFVPKQGKTCQLPGRACNRRSFNVQSSQNLLLDLMFILTEQLPYNSKELVVQAQTEPNVFYWITLYSLEPRSN